MPLYQQEICTFFHGFCFGFRDLFEIPFADWDHDNLLEIPPISSLVLSGKLFIVHFQFNRTGYYLTIQPDRDVYKLHDINVDAVNFGCLNEI